MTEQKPDLKILDNLPKVNNFLIYLGNYKPNTLLVITVAVLLLLLGSSNSANLAWILPVVLLAIAAWYGIKRSKKTLTRANTVLVEFSKTNNFNFTPENKNIDEKGSLFQVSGAYAKRENRIINGRLKNFPFKLSDYHYETGSGKYKKSYGVRVMRLTLPRKLPHMVIDCLVEEGESGTAFGGGGGLSTLPIDFDSSQKIDLEGDFHKFFSVYAPDKYAISALTVIAPDTMEILMRMKSLCDIEVVENYIYFYWPDEKIGVEQYKSVFSTVFEVMDEIGDKLSGGDIFATKAQKQIHSETSKNPVMLRKNSYTVLSVILILILTAIFVGYGALTLGIIDENDSPPVWLAIPIIGLPFLAMFAILKKSREQRKLRVYLRDRYHN